MRVRERRRWNERGRGRGSKWGRRNEEREEGMGASWWMKKEGKRGGEREREEEEG